VIYAFFSLRGFSKVLRLDSLLPKSGMMADLDDCALFDNGQQQWVTLGHRRWAPIGIGGGELRLQDISRGPKSCKSEFGTNPNRSLNKGMQLPPALTNTDGVNVILH
jgi:hypothetical protein